MNNFLERYGAQNFQSFAKMLHKFVTIFALVKDTLIMGNGFVCPISKVKILVS